MNNPPTDPIRKSSLPCTPPAEWEFHTWFAHPDGGGDMVPGERQRGVVVRRRIFCSDWEPVRPDCWAEEPPMDASPAGLVAVPPTTTDRDRIADAVIPLLLDTLPKVIARARGYEIADVLADLLPAGSEDTTTTRADVLREGADVLWNHPRATAVDSDFRAAADVLRRLAAETQPSEPQPHPAVDALAAVLALFPTDLNPAGPAVQSRHAPAELIQRWRQVAASAGVQTDEETNR